MELSNETKAKSNSHKAIQQLEFNMIELERMKDEIKRAKDEAMQSWLDSRPLIDELEKLQSNLAIAKNRSDNSKMIISDLESQLQSTYTSIRSKKEEEIKIRTIINKTNQDLEKIHVNMEELKIQTDEEKPSRLKLKQVLRLRKQKIRTLQLTLRAVRLESEAFGLSAEEAIRYINGGSEMDDNATVEISQEEYYALRRRAKEETSLADWRISVSMEQRLVAEKSRDSGLRRLEELKSEKKSRRREIGEEIKADKQERGDDLRKIMEAEVENRETGFPKARVRSMAESGQGNIPRERVRRSKSNYSERVVKKKKNKSLFSQFRICFKKITRWFR